MAKRKYILKDKKPKGLGSEVYVNFVNTALTLRYENIPLLQCDNYKHNAQLLCLTELLRQHAYLKECGSEKYFEYLKYNGRTSDAQDLIRMDQFLKEEEKVIGFYRHFNNKTYRKIMLVKKSKLALVHKTVLVPGMLFREMFSPIRLYSPSITELILDRVAKVVSTTLQSKIVDYSDMMSLAEQITKAIKTFDAKTTLDQLKNIKV